MIEEPAGQVAYLCLSRHGAGNSPLGGFRPSCGVMLPRAEQLADGLFMAYSTFTVFDRLSLLTGKAEYNF